MRFKQKIIRIERKVIFSGFIPCKRRTETKDQLELTFYYRELTWHWLSSRCSFVAIEAFVDREPFSVAKTKIITIA
jgi:hypothetical protein